MHPASPPSEATPPTVFGRLLLAYGVETAPALAEAVGAKLPTVKSWKLRDSVPLEVIRQAAKDASCNLEWLLTGDGPRFAGHASTESNRTRQRGALVQKETETPPLTREVRERAPRVLGPSEGAAEAITHAVGHLSGWVLPLTGDGEPLVTGGLLAPQTASLARPLVLPVTIGQAHREFQVIPQLTRPALAGRPAASTRAARMGAATADLAGSMAFDRAWMREHLGRDGGGFVSVSVSGDSMEPALFDGDTIIIDTLVDRVDASGVYVIRLGVDMLVKRIQRKLDGALVVRSDNDRYEPEELPAARAGELRVEGRLVWPRLR